MAESAESDRAHARPGLVIKRDLQRLGRNGSSTCIIVRKPVMRHLGWLPGQSVIVDVLDDDTLVIRRPKVLDLGVQVRTARSLPLPIEVAR